MYIQNLLLPSTIAAYAVKESAVFLPSDSLESQSYEFIEIAHKGPYYGEEWL